MAPSDDTEPPTQLPHHVPYLLAQIFVVEIEGTVVGFVAVPVRKGRGEIGLIAVHDDYRGSGLGSDLLAVTFKYLKQRAATCCVAKVRLDNEPAKRLFSSMGFSPIRLLRRPLLGDVWLMEIELQTLADRS